MTEKHELPTNIAIVAVVMIIAGAILGAAVILSPNIITGEKRTITSDGESTETVQPDKVDVYFTVETKGASASAVQSANSEASDNIIAALKDAGYAEGDISTEYYNVYEDFVYNFTTGERRSVGWIASHQIQVSSEDTRKAGEIVDIAVENGATQVNFIDFGLKQETEQSLRVTALSQASQNAREKAEAIAAGLGTSIKGVVSVTEGNVYYPPYRFDFLAAQEASGAPAADVSITPGNVEVSAFVSVTFELN
jgi:hypothetical protein